MSIDLIKAAEDRKYVQFEEQALEILRDKLEMHPKVQEFKSQLLKLREDKDEDEEEMPMDKDEMHMNKKEMPMDKDEMHMDKDEDEDEEDEKKIKENLLKKLNKKKKGFGSRDEDDEDE